MWILSLLLLRVMGSKSWPVLLKKPVWQMSAQVSHLSGHWINSETMFQACCSVITILRISSQHCFIVIGSGCSISLSLSVLLIWLFFLCAADPNEPSEGSEVTRVYFLCSRTAEEMVNYTTLSFYIWDVCICCVFILGSRLCGAVAAQGR